VRFVRAPGSESGESRPGIRFSLSRMETPSPAPPSQLRIVLAFAAIYLIWGSTYLAIRFAIESIPPLLMAGVRHFTAGAVLYAVCMAQRIPAPKPIHWGSGFLLGGLMLLGGNGGVTWSEQYVSSGLAALVIATVPMWIAVLEWRLRGVRPRVTTIAGIAIGLAGVALLIGPGRLLGGARPNPIGVIALLFAALSWSIGSLWSRRAPLPPRPLMVVAMQMLGGGALLILAGLASGEGGRVNPAALSIRSVLSLAYLVLFGSIVGYTAYIWLLRVVAPERAATYAFVNPVVAVILGWLFAGEGLTPRMLAGTIVIVAAVALVTLRRRVPAQGPPSRAPGGVPNADTTRSPRPLRDPDPMP
jgi:drug/metabolite transporter (DMT)-like permease